MNPGPGPAHAGTPVTGGFARTAGFGARCSRRQLPDRFRAGLLHPAPRQFDIASDVTARKGFEGSLPDLRRSLPTQGRLQAQLRITQRLQRQREDHLREPCITAGACRQDRETVGGLRIRAVVVLHCREAGETCHTRLQHGQQGRIAGRRHLARDEFEQARSHLEEVADLLGRQHRDHRATTRQDRHQPFALEDPDGFAHGPPADGEFRSEVMLHHALARRQRAGDDPIAGAGGDLLRDRERRLGRVGEEPECHCTFVPLVERLGSSHLSGLLPDTTAPANPEIVDNRNCRVHPGPLSNRHFRV